MWSLCLFVGGLVRWDRYTTEAWRASQVELSADRSAWQSGLQPWQVAAAGRHEHSTDAERINATMSEKAIATLCVSGVPPPPPPPPSPPSSPSSSLW